MFKTLKRNEEHNDFLLVAKKINHNFLLDTIKTR